MLSYTLDSSERETKWDVDHQFVLPDLSDIVADGRVERDTIDTVSAYYDTDDGDLRTLGILLRRRDGDDDTGWQLRLPDGASPELYWPLSDVPPAEVASLLVGVTGGKSLHNVGTIHTVRHRQRINAASSDDLIAEIAEDEVRASSGDRLLAWREIGIEAGGSAERQIKKLRRLLKKAGAKPTRYSSKLAHLSGAFTSTPEVAPAVYALTAYLNTQIEAVISGDIALRRGQDPIHDTRVALRRLRSTLRVFAPLIRPDAVDGLEDELKWYAGLLGEVRDCQVQQQRFTEALDELPEEIVLGPVRSRIRSDLQAIELPARREINEAMDSPRYLHLIAELRRWHADPPLREEVSEKALRSRAGKAARKADTRLAAAIAAEGAHRAELLHGARKAAKRARYAAELRGELPDAAGTKRTVKRYKEIQSVLGDHQDTVVAREMLRRIGVAAGTTEGENGFTFGMLYAREQHIAQECSRAVQNL